MNFCFYCGEVLTKKNETLEHIIPNGIGGKLTSKKLLCKNCNNVFSKYDADLCENLRFCTNFLNPKRRGKNPSIKMQFDGIPLIREADGEYYSEDIIKIEPERKGVVISYKGMFSSDEKHKQLKKQKILNVCRGQIKKLNIPVDEEEKIINEFADKFEKSIIDIKNPCMGFRTQFNEKSFYSSLKVVLEFYLNNNFDIAFVNEKINFLKELKFKEMRDCTNYFYPKDFYSTDSIYHTIFLKGDNKNKLLFACISFYGTLNLIISLNTNYIGEDFEKSYCYDLRNHVEKQHSKSITLTQSDMQNILKERGIHNKDIEKAFNAFIPFFQEREFNADKFMKISENSFKSLMSKNFIDDPISYTNQIKALQFKSLKEDDEYKCMLDENLERLINMFLAYKTYDVYIENCAPYFISNIFSSILGEEITKNPNILKDRETLSKVVCAQFCETKTNNQSINIYLKRNRHNLEDKYREFINQNDDLFIRFQQLLKIT